MVCKKLENAKAVVYIILHILGCLMMMVVSVTKKQKRVLERVMGGHFWWF